LAQVASIQLALTSPADKEIVFMGFCPDADTDNFVVQHFWARWYFVSTLDRDEEVIGEYTKIQEKEDELLDQLGLWR